jgi:hypothetical protein
MIKMQSLNAYLTKWREIAMFPEVDEAIQEIQGDAIVFDELEPAVKIDLDEVELPDAVKKKIEASFEKILYMLNFDEFGDDLFRQWYVDGQLNVECVYDNNQVKKGVQKLVLLSPFNLFKLKQKGINYYFYNANPSYKPEDDLEKSDRIFKDEQMVRVVSGIWSIDKKIPLSFIHKAVKPVNQLSLIEDALVIYRLTRAPEKRVFYIDTGRLPKTKAEEHVKSLIRKYRQKKIYNVDTGNVENKNRSISILEDFWFPTTSDGRGTKVDMLQGANAGFDQIDDINYFLKKVYKSLNVPVNRLDPENRISMGNTLDVERTELKFFKFVLKLRKRFNQLFIQILKRDLLAQKILTVAEWSVIKEALGFKYSTSNEYSLIKKLQVIEMRVGVAGTAASLKEDKVISRHWIQREIMQFTEDEMKDIEKELEEENKEDEDDDDMGFGGGDGGGGVTTVRHTSDKELAPDVAAAVDASPAVKTAAPAKPAPANESVNEMLVEDMVERLKAGDIVMIKDKKYALDSDTDKIVEVTD